MRHEEVRLKLEQGHRVFVPSALLCLQPKHTGAYRCVHHLAHQMVEKCGGGVGALVKAQCKETVVAGKKCAWPAHPRSTWLATSLDSHSASVDMAWPTNSPKLCDCSTPCSLRRLYTHVDFVAKRHNSWRFQHPFFAPKKSISFFRPTPRGFSSWDTTTSPFVALRAAHTHPRFRAWNLSI